MTTTVFIDKTTVIQANWLNDVNTCVYGATWAPTFASTIITGKVNIFDVLYVGRDTVLATNGYNISGAEGVSSGAIELRSNSGTTDRGWRIGRKNNSNVFASDIEYLDSSGFISIGPSIVFSSNLGLGVTPSAWDSINIAFEGYNGTYFASQTNATANLHIGANSTYAGGAWKYRVTGQLATRYNQLNGVHTWFTAPSGTAGNSITWSTDMSLAAGVLTILHGIHVAGAGAVATNEAFGTGTLSANTTGANNLASGNQALAANTTGSLNTACGSNALPSNTTGTRNAAVGTSALFSNTTGFDNTAIGQAALSVNIVGQYNTAVGSYALYANTTGQNTGIGYHALYANTTGYSNAAIGATALSGNTTGSYNVACGYQALISNSTGSGNTSINPQNSAGTYAPVFNPTTENNRLCLGSTGVTNAYVQTAWTVVSDARDKTDFAPVPHGLDFVSKLQPTAYRYKMNRGDIEGHGPIRYGFKAQDVLALEGDTPVIVDAEDLEKLRFNDQSMIAVLVNALQELNTKFEAYVSGHP